MYPYLYLKAMLVALVVWLIIFAFKKEQRKEILVIGIFAAIAGPIQELWYTKDYWHPEYVDGWPWIEDVLFGFAVIGIAAVVYETLLGNKIKELMGAKPAHPFVFLSLLLLVSVGMGIFVPVMNSIYAAILAFMLTWVCILFLRKDLFLSSLYSASIMLIFMFIGYKGLLSSYPGLVLTWWKLDRISGILIAGIPLEEYVWFFTMTLAIAPLYELWKGIKFVKR